MLTWSSCAAADYLTPERRAEKYRIDNKISQMLKSFGKHDLSPIETAYAEKDLPALWAYTDLCRSLASRGERDRQKDPALPGLAQQFKELLYKRLTSIPGYAKWMGDEIDNTSHDWSLEDIRVRNFNYLANFPTPEGIHEIGRFLFDQRRPGWRDDIPREQWIAWGGPLPQQNNFLAIRAMDQALGKESPWQPYKNKHGHLTKNFSQVAPLLLEWWCADASLPFRNNSPYPLPPPAQRIFSPHSPPLQATASPAPVGKNSLDYMLAGILIAALLAVGLAMKRARRA